ncbi:hypothetical protein CLU79DRAFT_767006 [Phycomyces nitens]|nr:hypothetical protein CLU79DRAFT_767006 [Phycomyces nitens]
MLLFSDSSFCYHYFSVSYQTLKVMSPLTRPLATGAAIVGIPSLLIVLSHLKSLPLVYTFRSWFLLKALVKQAKETDLVPKPLFTVVNQDHRCLLDDIDYNQHMNKRMYNKVLDFSRIHLLYAVFPRVMMDPTHHVFAHNAGVVTLFKREISPLQHYTVQTRIWTWNTKWLLLQHRFVTISASGKEIVHCVAVSKLVFKQRSGKTITPQAVAELCGHDLWSDQSIEERRAEKWKLAEAFLGLERLFDDNEGWNEDGMMAKL